MTVVDLKPQSATFDDFWEAYPKKVGKPLARAKWEAITNGGLDTKTLDRDSGTYIEIHLQADPMEIVEGAKRYRKSQVDPQTYRMRDGGRYIAHPATWLNQGRWMDD